MVVQFPTTSGFTRDAEELLHQRGAACSPNSHWGVPVVSNPGSAQHHKSFQLTIYITCRLPRLGWCSSLLPCLEEVGTQYQGSASS